jgi:hypothetical protein
MFGGAFVDALAAAWVNNIEVFKGGSRKGRGGKREVPHLPDKNNKPQVALAKGPPSV